MDIEVNDAMLTEHTTGVGIWQITYTIDGHTHSHVFPHSTFHWRVAEYGLDPNNVDGLLEAILYEPHTDYNPNDPQSLGNAATITDAKTAYLNRIAQTKGAGRVRERKRKKTDPRMIDPSKTRGKIIADNDTDTATPLAMIKRYVQIDPTIVTAMRDTVTAARDKYRATRD